MTTYFQYINRANNDIKRITWICGSEKVLIEDVIDRIRANICPNMGNYISLSAGNDSEAVIWDAVNQYPLLHTDKRLILVRNAEAIENWSPLSAWIEDSSALPNVYLLFVSNDVALYGKKDFHGVKPWLPPKCLHKQTAKVTLIECKQPKRDDLLKIVKSNSKADDKIAGYLIDRVGSDVYEILNVCRKLELFGGQMNERIVDALCEDKPTDDFVTLLLLLKKSEAIQALSTISVKDYGSLIDEVENKLDVMEQLNVAVRKGMYIREIVQTFGMSEEVAVKLLVVAKHYDKISLSNRRKLLAVIDEYHSDGAGEGLMESLTNLW